MSLRKEHIADLLDKIALFRGLAPNDLCTLVGLLHSQRFLADSTIITTEQVGEVVYFVIHGTVKVQVTHGDCADVCVAILGAGDIVGEMCLLDNAPRCATVVTLEDSTLLWMNRLDFRRCLRSMPMLAYNLACILAARLRLADEHIQELATCEVKGRVARPLPAFADDMDRPRRALNC